MAKASNANTRVFIDEFDISGFINAANQDLKQEAIVVTALSDTGPRRLTGNYDYSLAFNGFIDTADDSFDEQIFAMLADTSDHYVTCLFGANAEGSVSYDTTARVSGQPRKGAVGGAILLDISAEGSNGIARGMVIRNATISANGNGTGRNIGASTAGQTFQVMIRVLSGTFTSFDVNIDESQNDGGGDPYANVAGLSQTGINAVGVWCKTVTAATEAYKRVSIANWNGTDAVLLVTAGIVRGT